MNIGRIFVCVIFAASIGGCVRKPYEVKVPAKRNRVSPLYKAMDTAGTRLAGIESGLKARKDPEAILASLAGSERDFKELAGIKPLSGSPELYLQYCQTISGIILDVKRHVNVRYWQAAESSFYRIQNLWKEMQADFGPR